MAKLQRESKLRERRAEKAARKDARRYASEHPEENIESPDVADTGVVESDPAPTPAPEA